MPAQILKLNRSAEFRMTEINKIRECKEKMDELEQYALELNNRKEGDEDVAGKTNTDMTEKEILD